jgi:hypothetical protein
MSFPRVASDFSGRSIVLKSGLSITDHRAQLPSEENGVSALEYLDTAAFRLHSKG